MIGIIIIYSVCQFYLSNITIAIFTVLTLKYDLFGRDTYILIPIPPPKLHSNLEVDQALPASTIGVRM